MRKISSFLTLSVVSMILLSCGCNLAFAQGSKTLTDEQIEKQILAIMDECHTVGMAVSLVKGDKPVFQHAFGYRDLASGEPLEIDDIFRIASISKSFSGVSIMQLVEAGKIRLEDDVNQYLGFSLRNPRHPDIPITVKMLLSHTSSMIDLHGADWYRDDRYVNPAKTSADTIAMVFAEYAPGQGYKYCNRALNLIGMIIEKVSGERFDDYVRNHILLPMGITNAGYNVDSLDRDKMTTLYVYNEKSGKLVPSAKTYVRNNEKKVDAGTYRIGVDGCYWSPTGGMKISARDLVKWMKTLQNGGVAPNGARILSEDGIRTLLTPVTPADPGVYYCLTTRTEPRIIEGKVFKGHTGSAQGLKSCMFFDPNSDWGFVCLCSSTRVTKINDVIEIYYRVINLLYDQYRAELEATR